MENTRVIDTPYDLIRSLFTLVGSLQVLMLICLLAISAFKPWGRRLASHHRLLDQRIALGAKD